MGFSLKNFAIFSFFSVLLGASLFGQESIRVRDAGARCGVYIQALGQTNTRKHLADFDEKEIRRALAENPKVLRKLQQKIPRVEFELVVLGAKNSAEEQSMVRIVEGSLSELGVKGSKIKKIRHGYYVSQKDKPSSGIWVADLDPGAFETFLKGRPDLRNAQVYIAGLPYYDSLRKRVTTHARAALDLFGYSGVNITAITSPKTLADRVRMFFPMKEDWQKPTIGELVPSISLYALSNTVFTSVMLATEPMNIAIPVAVVNGLQSALMTVPRQFWGNYFSRSRNYPERIGKQLGLTFVFTGGIVGARTFGEGGLAAAANALFTIHGVWETLKLKWAKMAFQTGWRVPVENGIPTWVAQETRKNKDNEKMVRRMGTWYRQIATNIATPAWGYSTITKSYLADFITKWTWGEVIMGGVGLTFAVANRYPKMYSAPVVVVDFIKKKIRPMKSEDLIAEPENLPNFSATRSSR